VSDKGEVMSFYTVRKVPTGELCGNNLTAVEAASVVLSHSVARYEIRRGEGGFYWLWIQSNEGEMEIAYIRRRPVGGRAETRQVAWLAIAPQVLEMEWPGIRIWITARRFLRLVQE
jgi:hypothetical protein